MNEGRWKGTVSVKCASCNYSEELKATLMASQAVTVVEWTCPRCDAKSSVRIERQAMNDIDITE